MQSFHTSSVAGPTSKSIFDTAIQMLGSQGFSISERTKSSVTLEGPGLNSTRENPLLGATKITLSINGKNLDADAELGGVERLQRFVTWFPFLLGTTLGLFAGFGGGLLFGQLFDVGFGVPGAEGWRWLVAALAFAMLPVSPWFFISPWISRSIQKRTEDSIATLVQTLTASKAAV